MPRRLFIVSPDDPVTYRSLRNVFEKDPEVQVIFDRRAPGVKKRRERLPPPSEGDRRTSRPEVDEQIRAKGWAVIELDSSR